MADIGVLWKRSAVAERALVHRWLLGMVLPTHVARPSIGTAFPLPRNDVGRRMADWVQGVVEAVRERSHTRVMRREPTKRYQHPRRESFIEDAAMAREMYRL
jgi:hypothetical protein